MKLEWRWIAARGARRAPATAPRSCASWAGGPSARYVTTSSAPIGHSDDGAAPTSDRDPAQTVPALAGLAAVGASTALALEHAGGKWIRGFVTSNTLSHV